MSKYLKQDNMPISVYKSYLQEKNNKSKNELLKEIRSGISKRYTLCSDVEKIFDGVCISNDALDTLDDIFDIEDLKSPLFYEELAKAYPLAITYPKLTADFIKELLPFYSTRIFEELDLFEELDKAYESKKDEDFEAVMNKAVVAKISYDDKWKSEAFILDVFKDKYSSNYIEYLKKYAIRNYIDFGNIILGMPSSDLVAKDERLVDSINDIYGINIIPFSYKITISYANYDDLEEYHDLIYDTPDEKIMASFTLEDYLNDVRKNEKTLTK